MAGVDTHSASDGASQAVKQLNEAVAFVPDQGGVALVCDRFSQAWQRRRAIPSTDSSESVHLSNKDKGVHT